MLQKHSDGLKFQFILIYSRLLALITQFDDFIQ